MYGQENCADFNVSVSLANLILCQIAFASRHFNIWNICEESELELVERTPTELYIYTNHFIWFIMQRTSQMI